MCSTLPLIYQNGAGNGTLGAPLAPGYYTVRLTIVFIGPNVAPSIGRGLNHAVEVPIQILP